MTEAPFTPLFTHDEPGGAPFVIKDLTTALTAGGVPYPTANARVAAFAKKDLIHAREKGTATQPNKFALSDMGAAVILSALQDAGIASQEVLQAASRAIYTWSAPAQRSPRTHHPITQALDLALRGESITFDLQFWRDTQSGERFIDAAITAEGSARAGWLTITPTMVPTAAVIVVLDQHFQPVLRHLRPKVGH